MLSIMVGFKRVQATVDDVTAKLTAAATDTKTAITALAVLGVAALAIAVIALLVARKARVA